MSYSVAANTQLFGDNKGNYLDDLTNPNVGQWPRVQAIQKITRIVVYSGDIIDSIRVTYLLANSSTPTIQHGGPGGKQNLTFDIGANEKLIAVYGTRLVKATGYGAHNIVRLSFVVGNSSGDVPTTKVYTTTGVIKDTTEKFEFTWAVAGASSYTLQPQGATISFLQAIGFSKVLDNPTA
ncbi:hypothetical protein V8E53_006761 [Lactarius tabidus]